MAKAKKPSGKKKKGKAAGRRKAVRAAAKKKAAGKRTGRSKPKSRPAQAVNAGASHTPVSVPGAWPFPMLSKT